MKENIPEKQGHGLHNVMIYADNAATTQLDPDAFEAMRPFLVGEYGNASQPYSFSRPVKKALRASRETIARCIGAEPEEIYFTSGGTESDNWAIKSVTKGPGSTVVSDVIEHHAVLNSLASLESRGQKVILLPVDRQGIISQKDLARLAGGNICLVSVMTVNNEIGTIEPISRLSEATHRMGALFHTDAVQAVGHIPIDVKVLDVDMLSASGHKFHGPKGIGFLYIRKGIELTPFMDGGAQESGRRAGTENIASIVGMATALEKSCCKITAATEKLTRMEEQFLKTLTDGGIDFMRNGAPEHVPGNINVSIRGANGEMLLHRLDLKGICVSTGSACDSVNTQVSHVIKAIQVPEEYAEGTIRVSLGDMNEEADAIKIANAIINILQ